jgi:hypothetical protein
MKTLLYGTRVSDTRSVRDAVAKYVPVLDDLGRLRTQLDDKVRRQHGVAEKKDDGRHEECRHEQLTLQRFCNV